MWFVDLLLLLCFGKAVLFECLVRELGAEQFRRRELATVALRAFGPSALPCMLKAEKSPDPEVRWRAGEIIQLMDARVFAEAAERQVTVTRAPENPMDPSSQPIRALGTIMSADGGRAYILTTPRLVSALETTVEWKGQKYVARYEAWNTDPSLYLISIPYGKRVPLVRLPSGPTKGLWWNHHLEWHATFKENTNFFDSNWDEMGAGVFSLDESDCRPVLVGVLASQIFAPQSNYFSTSAPGAPTIQVFLKKCGVMATAKRRIRPSPKSHRNGRERP